MPESEERPSPWRRIGLVAGPVAFALVALLPSPLHRIEGYGDRPAWAAAIFVLMAIWWFTEALPIAWTACVPLVLFPVFSVFGDGFAHNVSSSAQPYAEPYIFLFLGGMALGAAMEHWGLHRRVALHIMRVIGTSPRRLLLGLLVATAIVSMWISNTATAVMMLPIAMALLAQLETAGPRLPRFGGVLMLAVAYGANVGGIGTKIGTATNSIFVGFVSRELHRDLGFLEYMAVCAPFVVLFVPVVWAVLWREGRHDPVPADRGRDVIDSELASLGRLAGNERLVAIVFFAAAALWIGGDAIRPHLAPHVPIFWEGYRFEGRHYEALVAMSAALALFVLRALPVAAMKRIPFSTLVLLGGSFALAKGLEGSGLSTWLATRLAGLAGLPPLLQLLLVSGASVILTAFASNTATVNLMLNVLPRALPLLTASAIASSCDFALPAGTPPNAIVFGSGRIRLPTMMRLGLLLDLLAIVVITIYGHVWIALFLS